MRNRIRLPALAALLFLAGAAAHATAASEHAAADEARHASASGFERIASAGGLELWGNLADGRFAVRDLAHGTDWRSYLLEEDVRSPLKPNLKWRQTMASLVVLTYTNYTATSFVPSAADGVTAAYRSDGGRLIATLDFTAQEISVEVEVWLEDGALQVCIPADGIRERGGYGVMQIDVLPFLLSAQRGDEGYLVYPDGCGALHRIRTANQPYAATRYTLSMYERELDVLVPHRYEDVSGQIRTGTIDRMRDRVMEDAALPVFGMAKNGAAALGVMADGEANAAITIDPSGYAMDIDRIYPSFVYRRAYKDPRPEVAKKVTYYEPEPARFDARVSYLFLGGEKADYSGMAEAYRSMLLSQGTLTARAGRFDGALSVFCGIVKRQVIFNSFIAATTFDQAADMVRELGLANAVVNLKGSGARGFAAFNTRYRPSPRLGGRAGFARLVAAVAPAGNRVFLEENFVDITADIRRPFAFGDVFIRDANGLRVTDERNQVYFVRPSYALDLLTRRYAASLQRTAPGGITFARIGDLVFRDLNARNRMDLDACVAAWRELLRTARRTVGGGAAEGGNLYAVAEADWLYDVPMDDSGCALNDEAIPFYQMVVHGLVDYSAGPGNLTHDIAETRLRWAEYGCIPYFELTAAAAEQMMETAYNRLYSSAFEEWLATAKAVYREYRERFAPLAGSFITRHERLAADVVKVTYGTGAAVYVNYGTSAWERDGVRVPARDYLLVTVKEGRHGP